MNNKENCFIAAVALAQSAALVLPASAATEYVWTGASDACWTNPANWTVGGAPSAGVPGRYFTDAEWSVDGDLDATAVFGTEGAARTAINLSGLYFVSNVVVSSGAPKYSFGLSGQYLGIAHEGGVFEVESGAAAPYVAGVYCHIYGEDSSALNTYGTANEAKFVNNSEGTLELANFGERTPNCSANTYSAIRFIGLGGTGDIKISSWKQTQSKTSLNLYPENGARLVLAGMTDKQISDLLLRGVQIGGGRSGIVEIEKGGTIGLGDSYTMKRSGTAVTEKVAPVNLTGSGTSLKFAGDGTLAFRGTAEKNTPATYGYGYMRTSASVPSGATLEFVCAVKGFSDERDGFNFYSGKGTVKFGGANAASGGIDILSDTALATVSFSNPESLGSGAIRIGRNGRLLFDGCDAATLSSDIVLTNKTVGIQYVTQNTVAPSATVEQGGSAALLVASDVEVVSGAAAPAVLTLANSTEQSATWKGVLRDSSDGLDNGRLQVVKTGSGTWTLSGVNTYSGATTVSAGTLAVASGASIASSAVEIADGATLSLEGDNALTSLSFSGTARLEIAAGATVEVAAVSPGDGAKLAVVAPNGAKIRFAGVSEIPAWFALLTAKGESVTPSIYLDGFISEFSTLYTGADGGDWTDSANWTEGVPKSGVRGVVSVSGGSVEVPSGTEAVAAAAVSLEVGKVAVKGYLPVAIPADGECFTIREEAALEIDGGTNVFSSAGGTAYDALQIRGGSVAVTNGGVLDVRACRGIHGTGAVSIAADGASRLKVMNGDYAYTRFGTGAAGGVLKMSAGPGAFNGGAAGYVDLGDSQSGTFRLAVGGETQDSIFSGVAPRRTRLGVASGIAEATLRGGSLQGGNWGVHVACGESAADCVTGRVHVAGGRLYAKSGYVDGSWGGVAVGIASAATKPESVRGELLLESGNVTVGNKSPAGFGIGGAQGFALQTGGVLKMDSTQGAFVLGYGSGRGEYTLSNGTFSCSRPLFVGGCLKKDLELQNAYSEGSAHTAGRGAASGVFSVCGGTVAVTSSGGIVVGADGRGRLEIGPGASVETAALSISNNVEGVLAFELGARRAGSLSATRLEIADGAKLEIDASGLDEFGPSVVSLVECETIDGGFAAENVSFSYPEKLSGRFSGAEILTERDGKPGLWLKLRPCGLSIIVR